MSENMLTWLRTQLDEQQHLNEGTGVVARLTYLDENGRLLRSRLAAASEVEPDSWTLDGDKPPDGWAHVNIVHDERAVRADIAAKRAILRLHEHRREPVRHPLNQRQNHRATADYGWRCVTCNAMSGPPVGWCQTVREVGLPYATRPGYRADWRP
jgi:hypothetical protein